MKTITHTPVIIQAITGYLPAQIAYEVKSEYIPDRVWRDKLWRHASNEKVDVRDQLIVAGDWVGLIKADTPDEEDARYWFGYKDITEDLLVTKEDGTVVNRHRTSS